MTSEDQLIEQYKKDFETKTGRRISIAVLDKWDEMCYINTDIPLPELLQMILDAANWEKKSTLEKSATRSTNRVVTRRQVIDLICYSNGYSLMKIGKITNRDHSTVLHSLRNAKIAAETDMFFRSILRDVVVYIKENHSYYIKEIALPVEA